MKLCSSILSPSCFFVCVYHISPWIAIVFSLFSSLPNSFPSHIRLISSSATHPVSRCIFHTPYISFSLTMLVLLVFVVTHGHSYMVQHLLRGAQQATPSFAKRKADGARARTIYDLSTIYNWKPGNELRLIAYRTTKSVHRDSMGCLEAERNRSHLTSDSKQLRGQQRCTRVSR